MNKGQLRNKKMHKKLDVRENFCPQCEICNMTIADSWYIRNKMYNKKCDELGQKRVDKWIESLDLKVNENFVRETK